MAALVQPVEVELPVYMRNCIIYIFFMKKPFNMTRRKWLMSSLGLFAITIALSVFAQKLYRRIPLQYIACLASEGEKSGTDASSWGLWEVDPGPSAFGCGPITSYKKQGILLQMVGVLILMIGGSMKMA